MRPRALPLLFALAAACGARESVDTATANDSAAKASAPAVAASKSQIEPARLEQIAREFFSWGTVQETAMRALTSCVGRPTPPQGDAVRSASGDDATHGGKLFLLFARYREAYSGAQV